MSWVDEYFEKNVKDIKSFIKYRYSLITNEDIADIAHDSYVILKDAESKIGTVTNIRSYVYTTLYHTTINYFRGAIRANRIDKAVGKSVYYNPLQGYAVRQMTNHAMKYIDTLPTQQRKAILAKASSDTTEEFNSKMDCSPESAKHHYFLARKKMLDFSKNFEYSTEDQYVEDVYGFLEVEEEDT